MTQSHSPPARPEFDLFDTLVTAVLLLDRDLRVVRMNAAAQSLLATSAAKIRAGVLGEVLPGASELVEAVHRSFDEGRSFTERDLEFYAGKQRARRIDVTVSPIWGDGAEPEHVLLEMINVERHQRIRLEGDMLMHNSVTSALLRGLAHEIKNPLGGIRGAAQLLERELEDQKHEEYTQIIIGEVDRLRALVDRMLGPRGEGAREALNVHAVLEHVRQIVEAERERAVAIERDYDPSLPEIKADRDELVQAFLNLLRNALEAVREGGGTVTIRTRAARQFTIGAKLHRLVICVQVIDTGPGVDPDLAQSIFFPLVSGRADGSGLGLSIAQSLIHRQGGLIGFESEPGHTVFSVWLPAGDLR